jgi:protein-disulfide isomerase
MMLPFLMMFAAAAEQPASRLVEGNPSSAVRVIVFEDLQCGDCATFRTMLDKQLLPRFGSKAAFEHRDFPLPKHNWSRQAAIAARFFERTSAELAVKYRRETMANRKSITPENFNATLSAFASKHGVDAAKAIAALTDPALEAAVEKDYRDGVARGVGRTPTVLVDGEPFIETFTYEEIAAALEKLTK